MTFYCEIWKILHGNDEYDELNEEEKDAILNMLFELLDTKGIDVSELLHLLGRQ